jgi:hypothetical protein
LATQLVNSTLRLQVLSEPKPVSEARVEALAGGRLLVTCGCALEAGAAVRLDASDRMILAEVLSLERSVDGTRALLEVRHTFLRPGAGESRSLWGAPRTPDSRKDATGS